MKMFKLNSLTANDLEIGLIIVFSATNDLLSINIH